MRGTARTVAFVAVLAVIAASCGGSGTKTGTSPSSPASAAASAARCPASAPLPTPASDHGAVAATDSTVSIEANDFFFAPTCVTGLSAGAVTLTVHNSSQTLHNVTIQSLGIDQDVPGGQSVTVTVQFGGSPLPFFCKYHRTSGMVGALLPAGG
jgi:plastocyanin